MTIDEMKKRKEDLRYTYGMIAERAGLPLSTVQKVLCGVTKNPRRSTMQALEMALKKPAGYPAYILEESDSGALSVAEESFDDYGEMSYVPKVKARSIIRDKDFGSDVWYEEPASERWPGQGSYTAGDYYALPDDIRVELMDGYIFDMGSPGSTHQFIQGELAAGFRKCIEDHGKHCLVLTAPFDVRLDGTDRTIVQPDILIICERAEDDSRESEVPDLAAEILSPSTRTKDCTIKLRKYMNAGVREYWIVDPKNEKVLVYYFENDLLPTQYYFDDVIPVRISGGICKIDFSAINARLKEIRTWNLPGFDFD